MPQHFLNKTLPLPDYRAINKMQVLPKGDASQISLTQHAQGENTFIKYRRLHWGTLDSTFISCKLIPSKKCPGIAFMGSQEVNIIERGQTPGDFKSNPTLGG